MKSHLLPLILLGFVFLFAAPLQADTLSLDQLDFHTTYERKQFEKLAAGEPDYLGLLLSATHSGSPELYLKAQMTLAQMYAAIEEKQVHGKSVEKAVKIIFKEVHERFLWQYREQASFGDLFQTGYYNCVTASALYGLLFEHFNIKYAVEERPGHVFLTADPKGASIRVETTDPRKGAAPVSQRMKRQYLQAMVSNGEVTNAEIERSSIDAVFNRYYGQGKQVQFSDLAGMNYYNQGVYQLSDKNFEKAVPLFEKAMAIYPADYVLGNLLYALSNVMLDIDVKDPEEWPQLKKYYALKEGQRANQEIEQNYKYLAHHFLQEQDDTASYRKMHQEFRAFSQDSSTIKAIDFNHYSQLAHMAYLKRQYRESEEFAVKAFAINPKDVQLKSNLGNIILNRVMKAEGPEEVLSMLDEYCSKFPGIEDDPIIQTGYLVGHLGNAVEHFEDEEMRSGFADIKLAEAIYEKISNLNSNGIPLYELMAEVYSEAWGAYVRMNNYAKAREMVNLGLKYDPENETLLRNGSHLKKMGY